MRSFYLYQVHDVAGHMIHSSIMYREDGANPDPADDEVRASIMEAIALATGEHCFPEHGDHDQQLRIDLHGPYRIGEPVGTMMQSEYNGMEREDVA